MLRTIGGTLKCVSCPPSRLHSNSTCSTADELNTFITNASDWVAPRGDSKRRDELDGGGLADSWRAYLLRRKSAWREGRRKRPRGLASGERTQYYFTNSVTSSSIWLGTRRATIFAPYKAQALKHERTNCCTNTNARTPVRPKLFDVEAELRLLGLLIGRSHERSVVNRKHAFQVPGHLPNAHQAHVRG